LDLALFRLQHPVVFGCFDLMQKITVCCFLLESTASPGSIMTLQKSATSAVLESAYLL